MLRLIHRNTTPPGGYRYVEPQTSFPFVADCLQDLVAKVEKHLHANRIEVTSDLAAIIENDLCHQMPEGICEDEKKIPYSGGVSRHGAERALNATIMMAHLSGGASSELAEWRAKICSSCEKNAKRHGCGTCRGINATLHQILGGKSTASDHLLGVCDAIGVFTKVLCHLGTVTARTDVAPGCWLRKAERKRHEYVQNG